MRALILAWIAILAACSESKFAGTGNVPVQRNAEQFGTPGGPGGDPYNIGTLGGADQNGLQNGGGQLGGPGSSSGGINMDDGIITANPQPCSTGQGSIITSGMCPANHAVYTVDDGDRAKFGCCPLPLRDILSTGQPMVRSGTCAEGEVLVGIMSGSSYYCQAVNAVKYALSPATKACYYGSGSSGRGSSPKCPTGMDPSLLEIVKNVFGSDGCVAVPYGSLAISRTGDDCSDTVGRQLLYKQDNQPVKMLP